MIHIKIELWPHGDKTQARPLGEALISNDGAGTRERGNYLVRLFKWKTGKQEVWKKAKLFDFPRLRLGPWDLMLAALAACLRGRIDGNTRYEPIDLDDPAETIAGQKLDISPVQAELFEGGGNGGKPGHAR